MEEKHNNKTPSSMLVKYDSKQIKQNAHVQNGYDCKK